MRGGRGGARATFRLGRAPRRPGCWSLAGPFHTVSKSKCDVYVSRQRRRLRACCEQRRGAGRRRWAGADVARAAAAVLAGAATTWTQTRLAEECRRVLVPVGGVCNIAAGREAVRGAPRPGQAERPYRARRGLDWPSVRRRAASPSRLSAARPAHRQSVDEGRAGLGPATPPARRCQCHVARARAPRCRVACLDKVRATRAPGDLFFESEAQQRQQATAYTVERPPAAALCRVALHAVANGGVVGAVAPQPQVAQVVHLLRVSRGGGGGVGDSGVGQAVQQAGPAPLMKRRNGGPGPAREGLGREGTCGWASGGCAGVCQAADACAGQQTPKGGQ